MPPSGIALTEPRRAAPSSAASRADERTAARLSVMVRLAQSDPHLLTKSEERPSQ
jgi:hypothetical protein